jgi:hypothetical protein
MTPTAWDFRNKLTVILNTAEHSGKPYVDVESSNLHTELGGDPNSHHRMPVCCEVMTRMMRPGDSILKETRNRDGETMMIRYILKKSFII